MNKKSSTLAIHGGQPVRKQPLPWEFPGAHWIDHEELTNVAQVIKAQSPFRYYGPNCQFMVQQFEASARQQYQTPFALGVNSGTCALHIVLSAMGVGPGDEVLLPGYLWVSCVSAIIRCGAIPVLVDVDDTYCMDPHDCQQKISPRSKVIMLIHMSGAPGDIHAIQALAKQHQLLLLEDCAQANGAAFQGKPVGSFGDAAIFSLQLNKNITSGEGGLIVCHDEALYQRCFAIHDLGYARDQNGRLNPQDENNQCWGVGSRMSELTGAMALAQLQKLALITEHMRQCKWQIRSAIETIPGLSCRRILDPKGDSGAFLIVRFDRREICHDFVKALIAEGIQGPPGSLGCLPMTDWGLHWYFNITSLINKTSNAADGFPWSHPANAFHTEISYQAGSLPQADDFCQRSMLLTIASTLSQEDVNDIIEAFGKVARVLLENN